MNTQALATRNDAWSEGVDGLVERARMIQEAVTRVMVEGEHYGTVPGTKTKALYQKGAHKLCVLFHFTWRYEMVTLQLDHEHREVRAKCVLMHNGVDIAEKEALCTTQETKYRYRTENTGAEVPQEYWKKGKDTAVLGGEDFFPRKVDGKWLVFHQIAVRNLPDQYNTVHQMAQKRAYVAAVIAATAASDAFSTEPGDDEGNKQREQRAKENTRRANRAPIEPAAESNDRRIVLLAALEQAAQSGESALLDAWQELSEADRTTVGKEFGRIQKVARSVAPLPDTQT
jgi:hypothetical protein